MRKGTYKVLYRADAEQADHFEVVLRQDSDGDFLAELRQKRLHAHLRSTIVALGEGALLETMPPGKVALIRLSETLDAIAEQCRKAASEDWALMQPRERR